MSGIFKSAAMSLLSRALQTLLSKYLSEVDVEGVNLPSLYDSDGHSGWGVRLKNVKLRHGVKLRDLPGKPKTTTKKQRRKKRRQTPNNLHGDDGIDEGQLPSDLEIGQAAITMATPIAPTTVPIAEGAESKDASIAKSTTPTATATTASSSSWWFWRSSSVATVEETANTSSTINVSQAETVLDVASGQSEGDKPALTQDVTDIEPETAAAAAADIDGNDENDDDDSSSSADIGADDEIPYILRLGKGGHVGVLDVRLVGSEIHVLVEDGFLIIEAVRVRPNAHVDDKADTVKDSIPPVPTKSPVPKAGKEPKTVGDRVLAENALARYFAAIPNLLLRDLRIQVVIRDQVIDADEKDDDGSDETEFSHNDSIVEICVEFLSITDGGDFLGQYRYKDDEDDEDDLNQSVHTSHSKDRATREEDRIVENEYTTKRIRTGRGPDGGIVVRIYPPGQMLRETSELHRKTLWARYCWDSATQYCLLRCSGVDIQSRLFVGTKDELASRDFWYTDEYEYDYDMEFNIFAGVDYVAPAPQPLPPMIRQTIDILEDKFWEYEGAATYHILDNGIQYCSMKSDFHKVARGLLPNRCAKDHLPCEYCSLCWRGTSELPQKQALDNATPMPGWVLSIITRDPLELNIERAGLEVLGNVVSLVKKPAEEDAPDLQRQPSNVHTDASMRDHSEIEYSDYSEKLGMSKQSLRVDLSGSDDEDSTGESNDSRDEDLASSFPSYMQPEKIQILGLHLSEIQFRVHVMQSDHDWDQGLAYCYWDALAKCVTMDHQRLSSSIKSYSDLRLDIGHASVREYKGALNRKLLSCGLQQRKVDFDEATIETMRSLEGKSNRSPWPSTAAALLDMQPALETLSYEERDRHAFQFRYTTVTSHMNEKDLSRSLVHLWLGPSAVNTPWMVKDQIPAIVHEARKVIEGPPSATEPDVMDSADTATDSLMRYKVHLDGGSFKLEPKFDIRLPLTTLAGERSPDSGIFIETILERVNFKYSQPAPSDTVLVSRGLSLQQLVSLPDKIRLSILLFLDDLRPLSRALCVQHDSNSFLLCNSVNKALVKVAKRVARRRKGHKLDGDDEPKPSTRRQELMTELLKLDDDSLEQLWRYHVRYQRQSSINTIKL